MGYYVDIVECGITATDPEEAKKILEEHDFSYLFEVDDSEIVPKEWCFKWTEEIYPLLIALSKVAHGYIELRGEDNALWKIELVNGKITELEGKIIYEERATISVPEEVLKDKVIVNERYLAAVVDVDRETLVAYDLKDEKWLHFAYYGSIRELKLLEDLYRGKDVHNDFFTFGSDISELSPDVLGEFVRKILEKRPDLDQRVKKVLLGEVL